MEMLASNSTCPQCGGSVADGASLHGLCARCLLGRLLSDDDLESERPGRPAAPKPAELAGLFPQYDVLQSIGRGGMGAVYKARQRSLDRLVALKIIPLNETTGPAFVERFHREARTLARLKHPGVVAAYDCGKVEGYCYLAMEYIDGPNLRDLLHAGPVAPHTAARLVWDVCDALDYAHRRGIVHRDIKPENILLAPPDTPAAEAELAPAADDLANRRPVITDFGLAKLLEHTPSDFTLTTPERLLGTPIYMAPEQIERPRLTDHRADLYALGVLLYEMLTGEFPLGRFEPASAKAAIDPRFDAIIHRCLEKDPERRFANIDALREELAPLVPFDAIVGPGVAAASAAPFAANRRAPLWVPRLQAFVLTAVLLLVWYLLVPVAYQPGARPDALGGSEPAAAKPGGKPASVAAAAPPPVTASPAAKSGHGASTAGSPEADAPLSTPVRLFNARVKRSLGMEYSIQIDYRCLTGSEVPPGQYVWVIETPDGRRNVQTITQIDLPGEGTLRCSFRPFGPMMGGPVETYLEVGGFGPFQSGRRISNVVPLTGVF